MFLVMEQIVLGLPEMHGKKISLRDLIDEAPRAQKKTRPRDIKRKGDR
jgi:hypothetical protein